VVVVVDVIDDVVDVAVFVLEVNVAVIVVQGP
jgi:hypothetical protein